MEKYNDKALKVLKNNHFRITKPRQLVIKLLEDSSEPLSAYEIKDYLDSKNNPIDVVSVYRIITCLEENSLVHRVLDNKKIVKCQIEHEADCTKHSEHHCHHLLICNKCNSIEETHCKGINPIIKKLEEDTDFKIQSHNIEFYGICSKCK